MISTLINFVAILAVLVLSHEFGHFWAARRFGLAASLFFESHWVIEEKRVSGTLFTLV